MNSIEIIQLPETTKYAQFDSLVSKPFLEDKLNSLTAQEVLTVLSTDLSAVDVSILSKSFSIIDKIKLEKDFFFELAVLCKDKAYSHPEWSLLSGRVRILYVKKTTPKLFSQAIDLMKPLLDVRYYQFCHAYGKELDAMINGDLDWEFGIFAAETLYNSYLTKVKNSEGIQKVVECIQHMYMRIASYLWYPNLDAIKIAYNEYSQGIISGPSPLQFNAGLKRPQLASCFVAGTKVLTTNRGMIPIEKVKINDTVITHKGNVKKVLQLHENNLGYRELYSLEILKTSKFKITGNHRLWALKRGADKTTPSWISVDELSFGDYVAVPHKKICPENFLKYYEEDVYDLNMEKNGFVTCIEHQNQVFMRIMNKTKIAPKNSNMKVYTLGVEDDHSYCVEGIIAENCFLLSISDNMQSISKIWHDSAIISMNNGGLGYAYDGLRHSDIGHQGWSKGLIPWLKIKNEILATVDQCFHGDTIVYTLNKGPIKIADVQPGDSLVRSDGKRNKVFQPISYEADTKKNQYYSLYVKHYTKPVIVSSCHPFLAINGQIKGTSYSKILEKLNSGYTKPEYTNVEDLDERSFISFAIPTFECDMERYSEEDCRLYGILLGDGSFSKKNNTAGIHLGTEQKQDTIAFVKKYMNEHGIHFWETERNNTLSIMWTRTHHLFPFTYKMLYDDEGNKHFSPSFLHLPISKIEQIFIGLIETDGCYKSDSGEITIELSDSQVIESLRYILLRMEVPTSGYCRDRVGSTHQMFRGDFITTQKKTEVLRIPKTQRICDLLNKNDVSPKLNFFIFDKKIWSRVEKKEKYESEDFFNVYDLEMNKSEIDEKRANYLTCAGIVHNGGSRRKGSGTVYTTDWNIDIFEFVDAKKPTGAEELRARGLFYALMISDEFMRRVRKDEMWSLVCPAKTNGLEKKYGIEFEKAYLDIEKNGLEGKYPNAFRRVRARELWVHIMISQITTGMPFIVYKDAVNRKSNQKNLGTIRSSNLCVEIMEYTDDDNIASCNLSSIPISHYVKFRDGKPYFDYEELGKTTRRTMRNLKQMIDRNYYPEDVPQIKYCNMRNKPIGIGIQDLAGCFAMMDLIWDSDEARELNKEIANTMYYHGMDENVKMAKEFGAYETFQGSPASKGYFQFDLWSLEKLGKSENEISYNDLPKNKKYDYEPIRKDMIEFGLYFSLVFSQMPTASSAHILGKNESVEPYTRLMYARTVLSGQFVVTVTHLVEDLEKIGLWNDEMLKHLFRNQGSIQTFPEENLDGPIRFRLRYLKEKYKTAFELKQEVTANLYLDRAEYQCQSSSNNAFMVKPTLKKLNAYHFHMWRGGAKTGMYYLHQVPGSEPLNFSLDAVHVSKRKNEVIQEKGECLVCGS